MAGIFSRFIFNNAIFNTDTEEVEESAPEIEFMPVMPPVDFVISPPYYMHAIEMYRKPAVDKGLSDDAELQEMMQMYAVANRARLAA